MALLQIEQLVMTGQPWAPINQNGNRVELSTDQKTYALTCSLYGQPHESTHTDIITALFTLEKILSITVSRIEAIDRYRISEIAQIHNSLARSTFRCGLGAYQLTVALDGDHYICTVQIGHLRETVRSTSLITALDRCHGICQQEITLIKSIMFH